MKDTIEKSVQTLFERNLESLLGVRFLATKYVTTNGGGRIDTLGLDENGCPVILEYKRATNENVVNPHRNRQKRPQRAEYGDCLRPWGAKFSIRQFGGPVRPAPGIAPVASVCRAPCGQAPLIRTHGAMNALDEFEFVERYGRNVNAECANHRCQSRTRF